MNKKIGAIMVLGMLAVLGLGAIAQEIDRSVLQYVQILNSRSDTLTIGARWDGGGVDLGRVPPRESRVYSLPPGLEEATPVRLHITLGNGYSCVTAGAVPAIGGEVITLRLSADGPLSVAFCVPE